MSVARLSHGRADPEQGKGEHDDAEQDDELSLLAHG
jgi:hypothetical protein